MKRMILPAIPLTIVPFLEWSPPETIGLQPCPGELATWGCTKGSEGQLQVHGVSLVAVLSRPELFHDQWIELIGVLAKRTHDDALYFDPFSYHHSIGENSIELRYATEALRARAESGTLVRVSGRFIRELAVGFRAHGAIGHVIVEDFSVQRPPEEEEREALRLREEYERKIRSGEVEEMPLLDGLEQEEVPEEP